MIVITRPVKEYCPTCGIRQLMVYVIDGGKIVLHCIVCKANKPEIRKAVA